jgi:hypothetical protein
MTVPIVPARPNMICRSFFLSMTLQSTPHQRQSGLACQYKTDNCECGADASCCERNHLHVKHYKTQALPTVEVHPRMAQLCTALTVCCGTEEADFVQLLEEVVTRI